MEYNLTMLQHLADGFRTSLPNLLAVGGTLLLGWLLAGLTWMLTSPDQALSGHPPDGEMQERAAALAADKQATAREPESGFARSARRAPFGEVDREGTVALKDAPETRLSLELQGVFATGNGDGSAFIRAGSDSAELYRPGDTIGQTPATLDQVHPDRVILTREGHPEVLRLPRGKELRTTTGDGGESGRLPDTEPAPHDDSSADRSTGEATGQVSRERWLDDPERAMESMRATPVVRQGELAGVEIRPTRNRRDFERAGLRPGDVVTSVDGQDIASIEDPEALLDRLEDSSRVDLTVERDGQTHSLTIELTQ